MSEISFRELIEKFENLTVTDEELAEFFKEVDLPVSEKNSIRPNVVLDETKVDLSQDDDPRTEAAGLFNFVNSLAEKRRKLKFKSALKNHPERMTIVTEGDSWFQFPVLLRDVIDCLSDQFNVFSVGAAGDTTENMIFENPEYIKAIRKAEKLSGATPKAFLFSSGGNDLLGKKGDTRVLETIVRPLNPGEIFSIENAYIEDELNNVFALLQRGYVKLSTDIATHFPDITIFVHSYDNVWPYNPANSNDTRYTKEGKWIQPSLSLRGVKDFENQRAITNDLLNRFRALLEEVANQHSNIRIIKTGTPLAGRLDLWHDEIHPNNNGYKIVAEKFADAIHNS